jgi:hypothetical protein
VPSSDEMIDLPRPHLGKRPPRRAPQPRSPSKRSGRPVRADGRADGPWLQALVAVGQGAGGRLPRVTDDKQQPLFQGPWKSRSELAKALKRHSADVQAGRVQLPELPEPSVDERIAEARREERAKYEWWRNTPHTEPPPLRENLLLWWVVGLIIAVVVFGGFSFRPMRFASERR